MQSAGFCSSIRLSGLKRFVSAAGMMLFMLVLIPPAVFAGQPDQPSTSGVQSDVASFKASGHFSYGRFGEMAIYFPQGTPADLVLFVSGDGGWSAHAGDMARALADQGALVAGIDVSRLYRKLEADREKCTYPAADFEGLAHALEEHYRFPAYRYPYLVGYGAGAALVYAMLAQAPEGTFAGAMSLGFCPDIALRVPLCESNQFKRTVRAASSGGYDLAPVSVLPAPWMVLQEVAGQGCSQAETAGFVRKVEGAEWIPVAETGPGYSEEANRMSQYLAAYERLRGRTGAARPAIAQVAPAPDAPSGLPLTEVVATAPAKAGSAWAGSFAIILTGDGGWAGLDREVAAALSAKGIPVVGFSTLQYFWNVKTPEQTAKDVEHVIRYYLNQWQKQSVVLIGYSMGAEVLPFVVNRLSAETQNKVAAVAAIAPGRTAEFEFHFSNWVPVPAGSRTRDLPVAPEVDKLTRPFTCIYPQEEQDSLCLVLDAKRYTVVGLTGGHHFNGDYARLVEIILGRNVQ